MGLNHVFFYFFIRGERYNFLRELKSEIFVYSEVNVNYHKKLENFPLIKKYYEFYSYNLCNQVLVCTVIFRTTCVQA